MSKKLPEQIMNILEDAISQMMTQMHVLGANLACVVGDEVIWGKGYGARNMEKNLPVTPNTMGPIGSSSKSYTALAIMQLIGKGK